MIHVASVLYAGSGAAAEPIPAIPSTMASMHARRWLFGLVAVVCWTVQARADEASDQYAVAAGHYAEKRWEMAATELRAFLDRYPNDAHASECLFLLAESQLQLQDRVQAERLFRDYLARAPQGEFARPALFRAGEAAYLENRYEQAQSDLTLFRQRYPGHALEAYVLPYLGNIALAHDEDATARALFEEALSRFPEGKLQDDCRFGIARVAERQGDSRLALRLYFALAAKPTSKLADDAQFRLGALLYAVGRYDEAIESFDPFEKDLAGSPWRASARLGRGWALVKLNRYDEAGKLFTELADDPQLGLEARYWLGLNQKAQLQWKLAAETLLAAAEQAGPDHRLTPSLRFHAGDALLRQGQYAQARDQFHSVFSATSGDDTWSDDALRGSIQAALRLGDLAAVEQMTAEFDRRFPDSPLQPEVRRLLVRSLLLQKEFGRAAAILQPQAAAGESEPEELYLLALACRGMGRIDEAMLLLDDVLARGEPSVKTDALLTRGSILVAAQRYADAVPVLETALKESLEAEPASVARAELAVSHAQLGQWDEAQSELDRLAKLVPGDPRVALTVEQLAEAAYQAGQSERAATLFDRLAHQCGQGDHVLRGLAGLAWSYSATDRPGEAIEVFGQLLDGNPPAEVAADAALTRGQLLEQADRSDEALASYDLILFQYLQSPQYVKALLAAARLRDRMQQDQEAATLYERLVQQFPEHPEMDAILYEWSWVLYDVGQEADSNARFEQLREQFPTSRFWADATYRLAQRAYAGGNLSKAAQYAQEALNSRPDPRIREHALYLHGQVEVAQQHWPEAAESFVKLMEEFPASPMRLSAEYLLAESYYRMDEARLARLQLERLIDRMAETPSAAPEPWHPMVYLRLAQVLAQAEEWELAMKTAQDLQKKYPDFALAYEADYLIGRCLAGRADFEGARAAYQRVIRSREGAKTETAAMAQWMTGESYFHQKDYTAALREYLRLEILYAYPTWQAAALLQAGKCQEQLGRWREATDLYARLLKLYPDSSFAGEAQQRLPAAQQRSAGVAGESSPAESVAANPT